MPYTSFSRERIRLPVAFPMIMSTVLLSHGLGNSKCLRCANLDLYSFQSTALSEPAGFGTIRAQIVSRTLPSVLHNVTLALSWLCTVCPPTPSMATKSW